MKMKAKPATCSSILQLGFGLGLGLTTTLSRTHAETSDHCIELK